MNWRFIEEALVEYEDAAIYFSDISPRLGDRFIAEFEAAVRFILDHPEANPPGRSSTRRRRLKHFPIFIVFRLNPIAADTIDIIAVAHEKRGDDYWNQVYSR